MRVAALLRSTVLIGLIGAASCKPISPFEPIPTLRITYKEPFTLRSGQIAVMRLLLTNESNQVIAGNRPCDGALFDITQPDLGVVFSSKPDVDASCAIPFVAKVGEIVEVTYKMSVVDNNGVALVPGPYTIRIRSLGNLPFTTATAQPITVIP